MSDKNQLFNFPIEPIPMRYSGVWFNLISKEFEAEDVYVRNIAGLEQDGRIEHGQFLDTFKTTIWKLQQLQIMTMLIRSGQVRNGDVLFFHDLWFPGLEVLFYLRNATGIQFKIAGMLHAGTYDSQDWTARLKMTRWAAHIEAGWFHEVDQIFVASDFHQDLLLDKRLVDSLNTGFPRAWDENLEVSGNKEKLIVFPHRLAIEKRPDLFDQLEAELSCREEFEGWSFVKTARECKTRESYHALLGRASFAISFAQQETWGIAMREAALCGAYPIVPDDLAYAEAFPGRFKYKRGVGGKETLDNAIEALLFCSGGNVKHWQEDLFILNTVIRQDAKQAIPQMVHHMRNVLEWKI